MPFGPGTYGNNAMMGNPVQQQQQNDPMRMAMMQQLMQQRPQGGGAVGSMANGALQGALMKNMGYGGMGQKLMGMLG